MNISFSLLLLLVLGASANAQVTGPGTIALTYHFTPGQKLHYHRTCTSRDPNGTPGYSGNNFDIATETRITVENIDDAGNATLLVTNNQSFDFKGGEDGTKNKSGGSLATETPVYRVVIDRFGNALRGEILKMSIQDSMDREERKKPGVVSDPIDNNARVIQEFEYFWPNRPKHQGTQIGARWHDFSSRVMHSTSYDLSKSASSSTSPPPPPSLPSYYSHAYDYSIIQQVDEKHKKEYRLITNSVNDQVFDGRNLSHSLTAEDQHIREADGIPINLTRISHRANEQSSITWTLKLVSGE